MQTSAPSERAEALHRLHRGPQPLVLVNAWDAASARVLERAGCPVIATTSAGMAWSLGHADGERLPAAELLAACERICRVVQVPVTVDIERGLGADVREVCALVRALMAMGVVGVNIEDGLSADGHALADGQAACERIAALRAMAGGEGVRLFINARTDAYLAPSESCERRFEEALRRARLFTEAGADGLFMPGLDRLDEIERVTSAIERPLNVYAGYAGVPAVDALAAAGVRRISLGCAPMQSTLSLLGRIAAQALGPGQYDEMTSGMVSVSELNRLFDRTGSA